MKTAETELAGEPVSEQTTITSRIVFTQGGKGGVGKTAFTSLLVEWYARQNLRYTLLDLDTENKARGSLGHFFPKTRKVNIHTAEGLDAFIDALGLWSLPIWAQGPVPWRIAGSIRCSARSRKSVLPSQPSES